MSMKRLKHVSIAQANARIALHHLIVVDASQTIIWKIFTVFNVRNIVKHA